MTTTNSTSTPQIPPSPPQERPLTNTGRLIQLNKQLLKVLTADVQSLSPNIEELIALIQVENFDVIGLNETWLDTQNTHLLQKLPYMAYKVFDVDKPTPTERGDGSIMYVKCTFNPIERCRPLAQGKLYKLTSIPRMQNN